MENPGKIIENVTEKCNLQFSKKNEKIKKLFKVVGKSENCNKKEKKNIHFNDKLYFFPLFMNFYEKCHKLHQKCEISKKKS